MTIPKGYEALSNELSIWKQKACETAEREAALRDLLCEHQFQHKPYDDFYHKEEGYYCVGCGDEKGKHQDETCEVANAITVTKEGKGDE